MDELIAKLEAASEGSRELDVLLYNAIKPTEGYTEERYTTSLDAALTLVPKTGSWHCSIWSDGEAIVRNVAWVGAGIDDGAIDDSGKTPALALCIAALKARKAADNQT